MYWVSLQCNDQKSQVPTELSLVPSEGVFFLFVGHLAFNFYMFLSCMYV